MKLYKNRIFQGNKLILQALRATLLLVPLLGLHYLVTPFRPSENHPWEGVYEVTSAITASFQVSFQLQVYFFCVLHEEKQVAQMNFC
jgi:calcitonin receptor-like